MSRRPHNSYLGLRVFLRLLLVSMLLARGATAADDGITIEEAWIEMPDGVHLSADLYKPTDLKPGDKLPVLLEYLPYRKMEYRSRNYSLYSYFISRGYVVVSVDIRGTGNSEGRLIPHEYSNVELDDGEVVIDWLSKQSFSNGNVGMFGISWGGFNAIQLVVRQPPALKAIIAVDATEDLFQDDVHYMDGIMHIDSWEMSQDLDNTRPGAPDYVIDDDNFRNRFDTEPWMLTYKKQQRDGPFWDRASARDKYDQIRMPTFHIGGWYDGYRDSLPRMLANVDAPGLGGRCTDSPACHNSSVDGSNSYCWNRTRPRMIAILTFSCGRTRFPAQHAFGLFLIQPP